SGRCLRLAGQRAVDRRAAGALRSRAVGDRGARHRRRAADIPGGREPPPGRHPAPDAGAGARTDNGGAGAGRRLHAAAARAAGLRRRAGAGAVRRRRPPAGQRDRPARPQLGPLDDRGRAHQPVREPRAGRRRPAAGRVRRDRPQRDGQPDRRDAAGRAGAGGGRRAPASVRQGAAAGPQAGPRHAHRSRRPRGGGRRARHRLMRLRIPGTLRLVEFRRFWIGQSVSMLGDQVTIIALPLTAVLVLDVTPAEMGYLTAAELLPNLIFSLHAGAWVDRRGSQRQTMIAADIGRGLLLASVPIAYAFDVLTIQQLYVVGFFSGVCSVLFFVAYNTVFTNLVEREHYVEANSLTNGSRAATFVVGPSIAGLLVQAVSGPFTLAIDAVSFLVSALFLGTIHPRQPEPEEHQRGSVMVGARFIAGDLMLRTMLLSVATINLFNFAFWAIYFLYVTHELHISAGAIGLVLGTAAVGTLIGSVI